MKLIKQAGYSLDDFYESDDDEEDQDLELEQDHYLDNSIQIRHQNYQAEIVQVAADPHIDDDVQDVPESEDPIAEFDLKPPVQSMDREENKGEQGSISLRTL